MSIMVGAWEVVGLNGTTSSWESAEGSPSRLMNAKSKIQILFDKENMCLCAYLVNILRHSFFFFYIWDWSCFLKKTITLCAIIFLSKSSFFLYYCPSNFYTYKPTQIFLGEKNKQIN